MSDEFDRIARLRARFNDGAGPGVLLGIGDDAAVLAASGDNLVLSVDTSVQGVHFERAFAPLPVIAARAFSAALSDLAAMAALPRAALCSLIMPAQLTEAEFDAVIEGLADASARYACPIVGGNLSAGRELSITTSVVGLVEGCGLQRSGARLGDRVCVTGSLGGAALGLQLLQRSAAGRAPGWAERWQNPQARIAEAQALRGIATAAIDVSDGALQDLGHLCEASGLGAELFAEALPLEPGFRELARELGLDPLALALHGGEDYELLYTVPRDAPSIGPGTCIGRMTPAAGAPSVLGADGRPLPLAGGGFKHFPG
jgi:thiamine-monophosphate kinase